MGSIKKRRLQALLCLALFGSFGTVIAVPEAAADKRELDRSGLAKKGKASYYGSKFYGKKMADGTPLNPNSNAAASRTLPLGTKAKVTNLENGKSAEIEIRDRGPFVAGRIVDLTPKIAAQLDFRERGIAQVEVQPLEIPQETNRTRRTKAGAVLASNEDPPQP